MNIRHAVQKSGTFTPDAPAPPKTRRRSASPKRQRRQQRPLVENDTGAWETLLRKEPDLVLPLLVLMAEGAEKDDLKTGARGVLQTVQGPGLSPNTKPCKHGATGV